LQNRKIVLKMPHVATMRTAQPFEENEKVKMILISQEIMFCKSIVINR
jgi:hypothetical protein